MGIFDQYLGVNAKLVPTVTDNSEELGLAPQRKLAELQPIGWRARQRHVPRGYPICAICGELNSKHEVRDRRVEKQFWEQKPKKQSKKRSCEKRIIWKQDLANTFFGIDGEGIGRNPHLYTLLAAVDEEGDRRYVENLGGLSTKQCFDFMLSLPEENFIFSYAFGYDLTKILADLPDDLIYILFRPELRARSGNSRGRGPRHVQWEGYDINLQGSRFELRRDGRAQVFWDIFKFFQGSFVNALKDWKVGSPELWERMGNMKAQRGDFENVETSQIREYCFEECLCMGQLARKLLQAHEDAGLTLTSYYGAGSSATAMLKKMGIKEKMMDPPDEMKEAIASAFFGGRFENSVIGEIEGPVYNHDISSAYPYQIYHLPCLVHANWKHTRRECDLDGARQALVRYALSANPKIEHWAPFPFRDKDGNICYPFVSGGGWVWIDEFKAARAGFPQNVHFREAWVLEAVCDCHPFKDIAYYYRERCRIGKEGPGIVMKLGCNSVYGKLAQSVGNGIFNNWAWAGMTTSGCRGQLLDAICAHKDRSKCLMVATDGVFTTEEIVCPTPKFTDTATTGKPLGGWETKVIHQNVFIARPGIYFPMNPSKEQLKEVKGRGVGKGVVFDNWKLISDSWNATGTSEPVEVANVNRFCGAKTSMSRVTRDGKFEYHRADGSNTKKDEPEYDAPAYGEWVERKVAMSFDPMPKRECVMEDGRSLRLRGQGKLKSTPYKKAGPGDEMKALKELAETMLEQPDIDMYEVE